VKNKAILRAVPKGRHDADPGWSRNPAIRFPFIPMKSIRWLFLVALVVWLGLLPAAAAEIKQGSLVTEHLVSAKLQGTRSGVDPNRAVMVYLPPGYADSGKSYPVIYYCHSVFLSPEKLFADGNLVNLLERGFAQGLIPEFIFVVADYSSPTTGSIYENSPATGRWLEYTVEELVPFIDSRFRTLRTRESRGLAGDMMGGRGAFQLAMRYPAHFSAVYALNPVATGLGLLPMPTYPDWRRIHRAKSFADLEGDHIAQIFVTACQAFLPNPDRPPFYCDFIMEMKDGEPTFDPDNALKLRRGFLLDHQLDDYAANLRTMRGIAFDWSRYDPIQDHVHGSEAFSRKLESYGVEHEAEEYRGIYWTKNWAKDGRFYTRLLPFFARHLVFQPID
jgi:pimeloyl-ACP methyl ester carboxylesterase